MSDLRYYEDAELNSGTRLMQGLQQQQLIKDMILVQEYNRNPKSLSKGQRERVRALAPQIGIDISKGVAKDKPTFGRQAVAFGGGFLDSLLFGLLKDSWYSNPETKTAANIGKLGGIAASFFVPGLGELSAARGGKAALGAGKAAFRTADEAARAGVAAWKGSKAAAGAAGSGEVASLARLLSKGGAKAAGESLGEVHPMFRGVVKAVQEGTKYEGIKRAATAYGRRFGRRALATKAVKNLWEEENAARAILEAAKALVQGQRAIGTLGSLNYYNDEATNYMTGMPEMQ